jgi:GT2 family glycosyltransferase
MIYILIPVFNKIEKTVKCLDSIYSQNNEDVQVIIVDDGSTDNSRQVIRDNHPDTIILNGTGSLFWTGSVHLGVSYILSIGNSQDWILLMNNDVQLTPGSIDGLVSFSESKGRNAIVNALSIDLKDRDMIIKSGTNIKSHILNITSHVYQGNSISKLTSFDAVEVDLLTARCLLHPIEVFWSVGNYNAVLFPHYGGDDEFTARAKRSGYRLYVLPSVIVYLDNEVDSTSKGLFDRLFGIKSNINLVNKWKFTRSSIPLYAQLTYYTIAVFKSIFVLLRR